MNEFLNKVFRHIIEFLSVKTRRRLLLLAILAVTALTEFLITGLARRTFVFYTIDNGVIVVEDRMLKRAPSREIDITRYIEETLLGPASPDLLPLFPRETRLKSLLYRDGVVYVDFSADAAFPPVEGGGAPGQQAVRDNFRTLYMGILRNFSYVRDVRFFIEGNVAYVEEFRQGAEGFSGI